MREKLFQTLAFFQSEERGATAVEYGLLMGLLSLTLLTVFATSGERIAAVFNFILTDFSGAVASSSGN